MVDAASFLTERLPLKVARRVLPRLPQRAKHERSFTMSSRFCSLLPGRSYSFLYPRHNFANTTSKLVLRRVYVKYVRDMRSEPIEEEWVGINPDLNRCRWLVICEDLDTGLERSFYEDSMKNILELSDEDCETLKGREYCVIDGSRVAFSAVTCQEAIAFQLGCGRGVVCAVMVREPEAA